MTRPVTIGLGRSGAIALTFSSPDLEHADHTVEIPFEAEGLAQATLALEVLNDLASDYGEMDWFKDVQRACRTFKRLAKQVAVLNTILQARAKTPRSRINDTGAPTQALVAAFLAAGGEVEDAGVRAERQFKEKFGVTVAELTSGKEIEI